MSKSFDTVKLIRDVDDDGTLDQVEVAVANLVNSAPTTLDTLDELAQALNDDPYIANTLNNAIGLRTSNAYIQAQGYLTAESGDVSNTYLQAQGYGVGDVSNTYINTALSTKVDETHTGNVSINGMLDIDDGGAVGPTVNIEGGGTSTGAPAANENTIFVKARSGTTSLSTGIGFWGTFDSFPADTNHRRAADIRAGYYSGGGTWGGEYISFNVGNGAGASNDAANMTTERVIITKDAMTANVDIEDTVGNVRTPRYSAFTSSSAANETITNEGVYNINSAAPTTTLTLGAPAAGTVICIYNNKNNTVTLSAGSTITAMRKGADNNTTHNATLTLGAYSLTTITIVLTTRAIVTGTDVT